MRAGRRCSTLRQVAGRTLPFPQVLELSDTCIGFQTSFSTRNDPSNAQKRYSKTATMGGTHTFPTWVRTSKERQSFYPNNVRRNGHVHRIVRVFAIQLTVPTMCEPHHSQKTTSQRRLTRACPSAHTSPPLHLPGRVAQTLREQPLTHLAFSNIKKTRKRMLSSKSFRIKTASGVSNQIELLLLTIMRQMFIHGIGKILGRKVQNMDMFAKAALPQDVKHGMRITSCT